MRLRFRQYPITIVPPPVAPLVTTWFAPLSQPYPFKPTPRAVRVSSGGIYVGEPIAPPAEVTLDSWFIALGEPVRFRHVLAWLHPDLAFALPDFVAPPPPPAPEMDSWFLALAEPVRVRATLKAAIPPFGWMTQPTPKTATGTSFRRGYKIDQPSRAAIARRQN